jgi:site-specific DNA-methyltransferase (adenine-specific)
VTVRVEHADCREAIKALADASVDACVTDPPYGLGFMGRDWDTFKATHKTASNNKADGWKWGGAPGAVSKRFYEGGAAYQSWCLEWASEVLRALKPGAHLIAFSGTRTYHRMACAIEDAGFEIRDQIGWLYGSGFPKSHNAGNGWGTALKPAWEPICLARKPLTGTVAANVQEHGTGALNIDGCRVAGQVHSASGALQGYGGSSSGLYERGNGRGELREGRWPANVIHDGTDEVLKAFEAYGESKSTDQPRNNSTGDTEQWRMRRQDFTTHGFSDTGTAARFFYSAKADAEDRLGSKHPTVKPVDLMAYLCRLVTPPGGLVLDPFAGSGTTGMACLREGFRCILIEREAEYVADIHRRLAHVRGEDTPLFGGAA